MNDTIIFDIRFGASGDMLLSSLFGIGLDINLLKNELVKLNIGGWEISFKKLIKYGMSGIQTTVTCRDEKHERNLADISGIIKQSGLHDPVKADIIKIFTRLAEAEAAVHGTSIDRIHFHEIGALDSIIDISAFCIARDLLKINNIVFNEFYFGTGSIITRHGEILNPPPAVLELVKSFYFRMTDKPAELVTPTAAAILTTLGKQQKETDTGLYPAEIGIGFGGKDYPFPSYTRAILCGKDDIESIVQIECNIDDMNPQIYPHVMDMLLNSGALDVYAVPVIMKKGRPGTVLIVIANSKDVEELKKLLYRETTTIGIRIQNVLREKLERRFETVNIGFDIRIKIALHENRIVNVQPEYEDCRYASEKSGIPLKEIMRQAIEKFQNK